MTEYKYDSEASVAICPETGRIAVFISDDLDGTMTIMDKHFKVLKQFESGFSSGFLMSCREALDHYKSGTLRV